MTISGFVEEMRDLLRPSFYTLKPFLVRDGKKHPFAVIAPGGGYGVIAAFKEGRPFAEELNRRGYHAFVLYYSIRSKARYPGPQADLECALEEIFAHAEEYRIDTGNYSLWGCSAGGHLVSSFCLEDHGLPLPAALVLVYPVITMDTPAHKGSKKRLLGKNPDSAIVDRLSIEKQVTSAFPPTYIWNGTADRVVDPENERMMENALKKAGVPYRADVFPNVGHGVGMAVGTPAEPWFSNAVAFWEEQIRHSSAFFGEM